MPFRMPAVLHGIDTSLMMEHSVSQFDSDDPVPPDYEEMGRSMQRRP